jgi:acetyl-CoA carboxylase biotin carboxyl carrier protein
MGDVTVRAEFGAIVWKIVVQPGADVAADQEVLILESMKTEIPVTAPTAGRVTAIAVQEGEAVEERQALFTLQT